MKKKTLGRKYFYMYKIYTNKKKQLKTVIIFINIEFYIYKKKKTLACNYFYKYKIYIYKKKNL